VSALAGRSRTYLLLYGGALLLAVIAGAVVPYSERVGGENGPYILLGALPVIAAAVAILLQWRLGALLLAAALPFEAILTLGATASGIKALALLTFVSCALALLTDPALFERFARLWQKPLALAVLAFMLWASTSVLWAADKAEALGAVVTFLGVLGLMVVIALLESRYLLLAWAALVTSAALSVPAGYLLPLPEGSDMLVSGRFGPGGAGPNTYACVVAIAFFVAYFGLPKRYSIIAYLLAPVFLYGIFASESRTALIVLIVTPLLALFVPRSDSRLAWRIVPMYALGVAALTVITLVIPSMGESASERYATLSQVSSEDTWNGRWSIWQGALKLIALHPILGVGAGNFAKFAMEHSATVAAHSANKAQVAGVAHNMFLGVASEFGLVGLILFLTVIFFAFKAAWRIARGSGLGTGIFLGLIVFLIAGMTLTWETQKLVYVLFGSLLALQLHDSAQHTPSPVERDATQ
jgi:O-antigen ligase